MALGDDCEERKKKRRTAINAQGACAQDPGHVGLAPSYHVTYPTLGRGLPAKSRCFEFFRCCIYVGDPSAPLYKHAALYSAIKLSSSYGAAAHRLCLGPSRAAAIFFF